MDMDHIVSYPVEGLTFDDQAFIRDMIQGCQRKISEKFKIPVTYNTGDDIPDPVLKILDEWMNGKLTNNVEDFDIVFDFVSKTRRRQGI